MVQITGMSPEVNPFATMELPPLTYADHDLPSDVLEMISFLPSGYQALAREPGLLSLEYLAFSAEAAGWVKAIDEKSSVPLDLSSEVPIDDTTKRLLAILARVDARQRPLERLMILVNCLLFPGIYYRTIVMQSPRFKSFRDEATQIVLTYQPRNKVELNALLYHAVHITYTWKPSRFLEPEGLALFNDLQRRFPEARRLNTLVGIWERFLWTGPIRAEWEDSFRQTWAATAPEADLV